MSGIHNIVCFKGFRNSTFFFFYIFCGKGLVTISLTNIQAAPLSLYVGEIFHVVIETNASPSFLLRSNTSTQTLPEEPPAQVCVGTLTLGDTGLRVSVFCFSYLTPHTHTHRHRPTDPGSDVRGVWRLVSVSISVSLPSSMRPGPEATGTHASRQAATLPPVTLAPFGTTSRSPRFHRLCRVTAGRESVTAAVNSWMFLFPLCSSGGQHCCRS